MRVNVDPNAITTFTRFDNLVFLAGTTTYLNIYAKALYLTSSGSRFGITTGGVSDGTLPTNNVTLTGNGTADGDTRIVFGTATCAAAKTTAGYCQDSWTSDDDPDNNGVGNTPATNGAVVQYVRAAATDTAGNIEGFPTAAFDWNTFAYYSTYVAYHDASGTADRIYVRDQAGTAKYQWDTPSGETHHRHAALDHDRHHPLPLRRARLGQGLPPDRQRDVAGAGFQRQLGGRQQPVRLRLHDRDAADDGHEQPLLGRDDGRGRCRRSGRSVRSRAPSRWDRRSRSRRRSPPRRPGSGPAASTTYLFFGLVGNIIKFNATTQTLDSTNTNPGSAAIRGRVLPTVHDRVFAGDDAGTMWAIYADNFAGHAKAVELHRRGATRSRARPTTTTPPRSCISAPTAARSSRSIPPGRP